MGFKLSEHTSIEILFNEFSSDSLNETILLYDAIQSKRFNDSSHCFLFEKKEQGFELKADYCIGLDWLGNTGRYLYIEPKLNTKTARIFNTITDSDEEVLDVDEKVLIDFFQDVYSLKSKLLFLVFSLLQSIYLCLRRNI